MRKLTKSRPLFFARRLAADSPRARTAAPRRRGRPRGRERAQCRDGGGRPSFARQRAAGWELGRREGRKEKRERKERRSLALLLLRRRRRRRPTGKTIINHIGFDRRRDGRRERERHSLHRGWQHAASTEGRGDRRTGGHAGNRAVPRVGRSVRRCSAAALTYYSECDADG